MLHPERHTPYKPPKPFGHLRAWTHVYSRTSAEHQPWKMRCFMDSRPLAVFHNRSGRVPLYADQAGGASLLSEDLRLPPIPQSKPGSLLCRVSGASPDYPVVCFSRSVRPQGHPPKRDHRYTETSHIVQNHANSSCTVLPIVT